MKRIVFTGGGTAGHVMPNVALFPSLQKEGYEIMYVGSKDGIAKVRAVMEKDDTSERLRDRVSCRWRFLCR